MPKILALPGEGKDLLANAFRRFDPLIQEKLLEGFIEAQEQRNINPELRKAFLNIYRGAIVRLPKEGLIISSVLASKIT